MIKVIEEKCIHYFYSIFLETHDVAADCTKILIVQTRLKGDVIKYYLTLNARFEQYCNAYLHVFRLYTIQSDETRSEQI